MICVSKYSQLTAKKYTLLLVFTQFLPIFLKFCKQRLTYFQNMKPFWPNFLEIQLILIIVISRVSIPKMRTYHEMFV